MGVANSVQHSTSALVAQAGRGENTSFDGVALAGIVLGAVVLGVGAAVAIRQAWRRGMFLSIRGLETTSAYSPHSEWWFGR